MKLDFFLNIVFMKTKKKKKRKQTVLENKKDKTLYCRKK